MTHRVTGIHALFSIPSFYESFQKWIGAEHAHQTFIRHLNIQPGQQVLDLGCGTGFILDYLPDVHYVGVDLSEAYINQAQAQHGDRGRFYAQRFDEHFTAHENGFDRILAVGLLHHLDDAAAAHVFKVARSALKPGGVLGTIDPCFTNDQSFLAKTLIQQDRGQAVRHVPAYLKMAQRAFEQVESHVHHDLLRIPYSHLIMTCHTP